MSELTIHSPSTSIGQRLVETLTRFAPARPTAPPPGVPALEAPPELVVTLPLEPSPPATDLRPVEPDIAGHPENIRELGAVGYRVGRRAGHLVVRPDVEDQLRRWAQGRARATRETPWSPETNPADALDAARLEKVERDLAHHREEEERWFAATQDALACVPEPPGTPPRHWLRLALGASPMLLAVGLPILTLATGSLGLALEGGLLLAVPCALGTVAFVTWSIWAGRIRTDSRHRRWLMLLGALVGPFLALPLALWSLAALPLLLIGASFAALVLYGARDARQDHELWQQRRAAHAEGLAQARIPASHLVRARAGVARAEAALEAHRREVRRRQRAVELAEHIEALAEDAVAVGYRAAVAENCGELKQGSTLAAAPPPFPDPLPNTTSTALPA